MVQFTPETRSQSSGRFPLRFSDGQPYWRLLARAAARILESSAVLVFRAVTQATIGRDPVPALIRSCSVE
jgi:hypothetical protein